MFEVAADSTVIIMQLNGEVLLKAIKLNCQTMLALDDSTASISASQEFLSHTVIPSQVVKSWHYVMLCVPFNWLIDLRVGSRAK